MPSHRFRCSRYDFGQCILFDGSPHPDGHADVQGLGACLIPAPMSSARVFLRVQGQRRQGGPQQRPWRQRAAVQWPDTAFPRRGAQSPSQRCLHRTLAPPPCSSEASLCRCVTSLLSLCSGCAEHMPALMQERASTPTCHACCLSPGWNARHASCTHAHCCGIMCIHARHCQACQQVRVREAVAVHSQVAADSLLAEVSATLLSVNEMAGRTPRTSSVSLSNSFQNWAKARPSTPLHVEHD